jgi:hypothetical protein
VAFVDMSGGSSDDAVLAIAHVEDRRRVLDLVVSQDGRPPFNPRNAVRKFVRTMRDFGIRTVIGDNYAGNTFKSDFEDQGIHYILSEESKSELYELFEPHLNAGDVELLDVPKLQEQLLTLVVRGSRIDHQPGDHDDWANAVAGAIVNAHRGAELNPKIRPWWDTPAKTEPKMSDPLAMYR